VVEKAIEKVFLTRTIKINRNWLFKIKFVSLYDKLNLMHNIMPTVNLYDRTKKPLNLKRDYMIVTTMADDVLDYLYDRDDCHRVKINIGGIEPEQCCMTYDNYIVPNDKRMIEDIQNILNDYDWGLGMDVETYLIPDGYDTIESLTRALEFSQICIDDLKSGKRIKAQRPKKV
jgi:hypothetical protein